jgi:hypothetical protein
LGIGNNQSKEISGLQYQQNKKAAPAQEAMARLSESRDRDSTSAD